MPDFRIIDPTINADYGVMSAESRTAALDAFVRRMGWADYSEFAEAGHRHGGKRTLWAAEVHAGGTVDIRQPLPWHLAEAS